MASNLISIIQILTWLMVLVVIIDVALSYFLSPFHPVRSMVDKIVNPLLTPIRKLMPAGLGFDLSPIVLILLIQLVEYLLINLLISVL